MQYTLSTLALLLFISLTACLCGCRTARYHEDLPWTENYNEKAIPPLALPDPLKCEDGRVIKTAEEWNKFRRPELMELFQKHFYGKILPMPAKTEYLVLSDKPDDFDGLARRREIKIIFHGENGISHEVIALLYTPNNAKGKVPLFAGVHFAGNHAVTTDPEITATGLRFPRTRQECQEWEGRRGKLSGNYFAKLLVSRGYALVSCCYHDIFPDRIDGWKDSVFRLFATEQELQQRLPGYSSIGAWSWGISRLIDCALTFPEIDASKIACFGHSRLGKTSLWEGACDERIGLVCVNDSGCGGAAPSRRLIGETLFSMCHCNVFGQYWFTDEVSKNCLHPERYPMDQHEAIALVAPRAIAIHSATEDIWADPKGEYLSAYYAGPVFKLFGKKGLESREQPPADTPVGDTVSYLFRTGRHSLHQKDWEHYLDVADKLFFKK